jgi:NADP-dependent 3-hydroxy acid dehydrogenase YdfG
MNTDKYAIVAGGTGSVGEGIVKTLLEDDWVVIVPGRSESGLNKLATYCNHHADLKLHEVNISKLNEAETFYTLCKSTYPPLHLFVATIGGWRQEHTLLNLNWEEWQSTLEDNLSSHFLAMKFGYPLLANEGTYVHINGMGANAVIPTAGPTVAAAAAQMRLALTLAEEQKHDTRKVYEIVLGLVNTRARNITGEMGEGLINPVLVAKYILMLHKRELVTGNEVMHQLKDAASVNKFLDV